MRFCSVLAPGVGVAVPQGGPAAVAVLRPGGGDPVDRGPIAVSLPTSWSGEDVAELARHQSGF